MEYKMEKRYEFIERILFLIRKNLENLPEEATLEEMINKTRELIKDILK
jgi:hypothetical protein